MIVNTIGRQLNGISYQMRVKAVNAIFDKHIRDGVSNRYIWRTYIYPIYGISERTLYKYLKKTFE